MDSRASRPDWLLTSAIIVLLLLLTGMLYWQTVFYLGDIWSDLSIGEYAHGYLVLAISLYLINYNRKRLSKITPCPAYSALPLLFASVLLWLVAVLVDVEALQAVALLFIVLTIVWSITGNQAIKRLAFPILFIGFAIPVWFPLSPVLQNIAADTVFWITRLVGVPAFRHENFIVVPGGIFSIEEACSGLRYLLAALTLGSLYAYLNYKSLRGRLLVVAVVAGMAVLANILRVFIVVYLGYVTDMQHPWVDDHLMLGWYLFGGMVALLLVLDARFYKPASGNSGKLTDDDKQYTCDKDRRHHLLVGILCVGLLATAPGFIAWQHKKQQQNTVSGVSIEVPVAGWSQRGESTNDWMPQYLGAISAKMDYQVHGADVSVFIAYYPVQKQGEEVINDLNRISNKKSWKTRWSRPAVRQWVSHKILEQVIDNPGSSSRLVWYWYNIGGRETVNRYEAKLLQLLGVATGSTQAYMVAVSVAIETDIDDARKTMRELVADLYEPLLKLQVIGNKKPEIRKQ